MCLQKQLIITADDYGMSKGVNRAIEACVRSGVVTSLNVMMNMDFCGDAVLFKKEAIDASFGIHFNLTTGKSVLEKSEVPTLVDDNGFFYPLGEFRRRSKDGRIDKKDIVKELTAQFDKYKSTLGQPDYWCSHEHVHAGIFVFKIFAMCAQKFNINKMRCNKKIFVKSKNSEKGLKWQAVSAMKSIVLHRMCKSQKKFGIAYPSGILTFLNEEDRFNIGTSLKNINWGKNSTAEMLIHPSTELDSPYFGTFKEKRIREYNTFSNVVILEDLKKQGIKLINFEGIDG